MTIKGLQKLASQHPGSLTIINDVQDGEITRQYISVWGQGVYPADGLPLLDEDSILVLLDVPADKRSSWGVTSVRKRGVWEKLLEDNLPDDREAQELSLRLIDDTAEIKFFDTGLVGRPVIAIQPEYLKPIGLSREHSYWARTIISNEGTGEKSRVLAVKLGYQLVGVISLREKWAQEENNMYALRLISGAAEDIYKRKADDTP